MFVRNAGWLFSASMCARVVYSDESCWEFSRDLHARASEAAGFSLYDARLRARVDGNTAVF